MQGVTFSQIFSWRARTIRDTCVCFAYPNEVIKGLKIDLWKHKKGMLKNKKKLLFSLSEACSQVRSIRKCISNTYLCPTKVKPLFLFLVKKLSKERLFPFLFVSVNKLVFDKRTSNKIRNY